MSTVLRIGEYQLQNLLQNRVKFFYMDLRSNEKRASEAPGHYLLNDSKAVEPQGVMNALRELQAPADAPIVLICENGAKSMAVAEELAQNSFINVFVIEGGTAALDLTPADLPST
jgi:rhodanese-related sulfurtransferase